MLSRHGWFTVYVKTTTDNMTLVSGIYTIEDSKTLTSKGNYHIEYSLKVYKSGKLVETITGESASATYWLL